MGWIIFVLGYAFYLAIRGFVLSWAPQLESYLVYLLIPLGLLLLGIVRTRNSFSLFVLADTQWDDDQVNEKAEELWRRFFRDHQKIAKQLNILGSLSVLPSGLYLLFVFNFLFFIAQVTTTDAGVVISVFTLIGLIPIAIIPIIFSQYALTLAFIELRDY